MFFTGYLFPIDSGWSRYLQNKKFFLFQSFVDDQDWRIRKEGAITLEYPVRKGYAVNIFFTSLSCGRIKKATSTACSSASLRLLNSRFARWSHASNGVNSRRRAFLRATGACTPLKSERKRKRMKRKCYRLTATKPQGKPFAARKLFGRTHAVSANKNVTKGTSRVILTLIFCVLKLDRTVNVNT